MATIYEEIHGLSPKIESIKRKHIIDKYASNKGTSEEQTSKYFSMQWEAFAWAAIIGFLKGKRIPIKGKKPDKPFKYSTINTNGSDVFYSLVLFAVAKEGYEILKDASRVNTVIEEYANGGFEIIYTIEREKGDDYFGDHANFLQEILDRKIIAKNTSEDSKITKIEKPKVDTVQGVDF